MHPVLEEIDGQIKGLEEARVIFLSHLRYN
jgi:hypothetical protein